MTPNECIEFHSSKMVENVKQVIFSTCGISLHHNMLTHLFCEIHNITYSVFIIKLWHQSVSIQHFCLPPPKKKSASRKLPNRLPGHFRTKVCRRTFLHLCTLKQKKENHTSQEQETEATACTGSLK